MGKTLVIKGADFALNAINASWQEGQLIQGFIVSNPSSTSYGKITTTAATSANVILGKVYIPANSSMIIEIKNNGVRMTDLNIAYIASQNNVVLAESNIVGNITDVVHPLTNTLRNSNGTFTVTNSSSNGRYYYLNFGYDTISGPAISVTGKKLYYQPA